MLTCPSCRTQVHNLVTGGVDNKNIQKSLVCSYCTKKLYFSGRIRQRYLSYDFRLNKFRKFYESSKIYFR